MDSDLEEHWSHVSGYVCILYTRCIRDWEYAWAPRQSESHENEECVCVPHETCGKWVHDCTVKHFCVEVYLYERMWVISLCMCVCMYAQYMWARECETVCVGRNLGTACLVTAALQWTAACPPVCHSYPDQPRHCRPPHTSPRWTPAAPTQTQQQAHTNTLLSSSGHRWHSGGGMSTRSACCCCCWQAYVNLCPLP